MGLIALAAILPASAAGQGGNVKMLQNGAGSGQGTGICPNPDCPQEDCLNNGIPPKDGTGMQYGRSGTGNGSQICGSPSRT